MVTDLPRYENRIRNVRFERCVLVGPAVVAPWRCTLDNVRFGITADLDTRSVFWSVDENQQVVGIIAFMECELVDCWTDNVAFLMIEKSAQNMRWQLEQRLPPGHPQRRTPKPS